MPSAGLIDLHERPPSPSGRLVHHRRRNGRCLRGNRRGSSRSKSGAGPGSARPGWKCLERNQDAYRGRRLSRRTPRRARNRPDRGVPPRRCGAKCPSLVFPVGPAALRESHRGTEHHAAPQRHVHFLRDGNKRAGPDRHPLGLCGPAFDGGVVRHPGPFLCGLLRRRRSRRRGRRGVSDRARRPGGIRGIAGRGNGGFANAGLFHSFHRAAS